MLIITTWFIINTFLRVTFSNGWFATNCELWVSLAAVVDDWIVLAFVVVLFAFLFSVLVESKEIANFAFLPFGVDVDCFNTFNVYLLHFKRISFRVPKFLLVRPLELFYFARIDEFWIDLGLSFDVMIFVNYLLHFFNFIRFSFWFLWQLTSISHTKDFTLFHRVLDLVDARWHYTTDRFDSLFVFLLVDDT